MEVLEVKRGKKRMIVALGIKGLVSEGEKLKDLMMSFEPGKILIGISPEEATGLMEFVKDPFEIQMSDFELIYGTILLKFGEVETPPPIFTQAVLYAQSKSIPLVGLDLDEETFGNHYEEEYSVSQMVGYITKKRKLKHKNFNLHSPEEFVMDWKQEMERTRAMNKMERLREEAILNNLESHFSESTEERIFAIIEYEFSESIKTKVRSM